MVGFRQRWAEEVGLQMTIQGVDFSGDGWVNFGSDLLLDLDDGGGWVFWWLWWWWWIARVKGDDNCCGGKAGNGGEACGDVMGLGLLVMSVPDRFFSKGVKSCPAGEKLCSSKLTASPFYWGLALIVLAKAGQGICLRALTFGTELNYGDEDQTPQGQGHNQKTPRGPKKRTTPSIIVVPESMRKRYALVLTKAVIGWGKILNIGFIMILDVVVEKLRVEDGSWIADTVNLSRLDLFYAALVVVSIANLFISANVASFYTYRDFPEEEDDEEEDPHEEIKIGKKQDKVEPTPDEETEPTPDEETERTIRTT
ncbi:hypothetical protein LOK49_LG08G02384 [Camellia lanceoleosa]|uniref:Uncharacterized protein n=1 Tax=Camellia lanceoleosa TaxID=1840588 RepID=A0ACC0GWR4_9ERIC|nr:hypothetical protein LOK49_LG08G02384 [Camellia lanceoleosa]